MKAIDIPAPFPIPFANNAVGSDIRPIPQASQIGIQPGAASLVDGFPPVCFLPITAGGVPPFGQDFNGLFFQSTSWDRWFSVGGPIKWSSTLSAAIGGYPQGAVVGSATTLGVTWLSTVDDNVTNPDTGGAGWVSASSSSTGDVKLTFKTSEAGWVLMNDGSIGNAASGATTRANADTAALFALLYNNIVDTWAPIQTSAGAATTRAAQGTAAAAYAANCRLVLPAVLGRALASAGAGALLTARALGQVVGAETHTLTVPEMPSHSHTPNVNGVNGNAWFGVGGGGLGTPAPFAMTLSNTGGGGAHNNMQPTTFLNVFVKL